MLPDRWISMSKAQRVRHLQAIFCHLPPNKLATLASVVHPRMLVADEVLYRQGQSDGGSCFLLCSGSISFHHKPRSQSQIQQGHQEQNEQTDTPENEQTDTSVRMRTAHEDGASNEEAHVDGASNIDKAKTSSKTQVYVGLYVQKRFVNIIQREDHGTRLYSRMPGFIMGLLSALTGCTRFETAVADAEGASVLELHRDDYITVLASHDEKKYAADCVFLRETPCFCRLSDNALFKIAVSFHRFSHPSNIELCTQGTTAVAMHIIRNGECEMVRRIRKPRPSPEEGRAHEPEDYVHLRLANLGPSDLIAHHELLSNKQHSFTVLTKSDAVELWSLSSETLDALERLDVKEMVIEFKQLKKELEEHGKAAYEFHKRRTLETGAARWEPKMQEKIAQFSVLQEHDTPQSKAATAAAARKLEEKEKRAGNFCSAIEDGAATVEKVLNQKVYTRNEKLKQRIHPVLLQPLAMTEKTLPNILSKRKKMFEAPTTVDLTAGIPEGVDSMHKMNFEEVGTILSIFHAILPTDIS
jgi:CRP-like cAMP-binding protein